MSLQAFLDSLGLEIEDPEEESFLLFSQSIPSLDLGFIDSKATSIDLAVGPHDLTIHQSPTILSSERDGGTTGAVVWKITPLFASWITSRSNALFKYQVLSSTSSVLELGCGISGVVAMALAPLIRNYILTDQAYVMKLLNQNLSENNTFPTPKIRRRGTIPRSGKGLASTTVHKPISNITTKVLDWEVDEVSSSLVSLGDGGGGFDSIIVCDCIYNDTLIQPLVQTCINACRLRMLSQSLEMQPTLCIIAQQLRSDQVFDSWLIAFHKAFHVWRFPDSELTDELRSNTGFVVHCGILR